jgi:hypothetical protein
MCDGCGCTVELEHRLSETRVSQCECGRSDIHSCEPFLMVVTDVDEESQIVTLHSVFDWEVPCEMKWFYGHDIPCNFIGDKVGHCFTVTLKRTP